VRIAEAADFYIDVMGAPKQSELFPRDVAALGMFLRVAFSIFDIAPAKARALSDTAFDRAAEWLADDRALSDVARVSNLLVEAAGLGADMPREVKDAVEFVKGAERWSRAVGSREVAGRLESLALRAADARVRTVLSGASAKLWLKAGDTARAENYVRSASFESLRTIDMLAALPAGAGHRAWSRRIVADRLGQLLGELTSDSEWLCMLFSLGLEPLTPEEATPRLVAIENALI
jgi:hypothetical protein